MPRITKDHCQVTKPHCCGLHHFTSCQVIQLFQNRLFGIRSFFSGNSPNHNNKLSSKEEQEQDLSPRQVVAVMRVISRWQDRLHRVLGARGSRCLPASKTGPGLPPVCPHLPHVMQQLHSKYSRAVIKADWRLQCELWKWTKDWTSTVGHKLVFFPPMDLLLACIAMTIDNISSNTYREVKVAKVRRLSWGKEKAAQEEERTRRHSFIFSKLLAAHFSRSSFDKWKCRTGEQTYQHWFPMQGGRAGAWKQSEMHFLENQLWPRQLSPAASRPSWHKVCSSAETQLDQFYRRRQIEKCQNLRSLNCSFDLATSSTIVPCQDFLGFWCRPPRWWRRPPWWWWRPTEWTHGPTDQLTRIGAKDAYASTKAIMCNLLIDHLVSLLVSHLPGEGGDRMEVWECNGPTGLLARQGLVLEMLMYLKMKINHPSLLEFHFK